MSFHPYIKDWFAQCVGEASEVQTRCWPLIQAGKNVLLSAPTGTGKTFAAFLSQINRLTELSLAGRLEDRVYTVYVSPLKALSHDVEKNLSSPLQEIEQRIKDDGREFSSIRVGVRTGDTSQSERQKMLTHPPHILVTTPESLYLMLTARKARALLGKVEKIIVDEIHSLAGDKRGSHLSLSLERLQSVASRPIQRIGLSATQSPMTRIRDFLVGNEGERNRPCEIVEVGAGKKHDLGILTPHSLLSAVCSHEQWDQLYQKMTDLIETHRTTLIFVNTRKLAERIAHHYKNLIDSDSVGCHHGSLSRESRLAVEKRLKQGKLKVVVATASLELGIDIGSIDLVLQIGSPRFISTFLQRMGRAGHYVGGVAKVRLVCLTREELVEAAAMMLALNSGKLDEVVIPEKPIDILAQQVVAEMAAVGECDFRGLYLLFRRAYSYRNLTENEFLRLIEILETGIGDSMRCGSYITYDDVSAKIKSKAGARIAAITSGGAIPELAEYRVVTEENTFIGTLDEEFAIESSRGDIFLLGNHSWRVQRVETGRVIVSDAKGESPSVPFWQGESPGRSFELSQAVSEIREYFDSCLSEDDIQTFRSASTTIDSDHLSRGCQLFKIQRSIFASLYRHLTSACHLEDDDIDQLVFYMVSQKSALGVIPTQKKIIFERFFDQTGSMHLVVHAPFGQKINKAWGLAMRKSYCRSFDFELQAAADDNGFALALGPNDGARLKSLFKMVNVRNVYSLLEQAILQIPLFQVRWRWNLNRSLAVLRFSGGKKVLPHLQRYRSDDLLTACFPQKTMCFEHVSGDIELPEHLYVQQTMRDCMEEAMDYPRLKSILQFADDGEIEFIAREVAEPSPFAHELINASPYAFLDEAPLEERRTRAIQTARLTAQALEISRSIDPSLLEGVLSNLQPRIGSSDELYALLKISHLLPEVIWQRWLVYAEKLVEDKRAFFKGFGEKRWLVHHCVVLSNTDSDYKFIEDSERDLLKESLYHYLLITGPASLEKVSSEYSLPTAMLKQGLLQLESEGRVLHGDYRGEGREEWCPKPILMRLNRKHVKAKREQIKSLSPSRFIDFTIYYHKLDHRFESEHQGFFEVFKRLEGFEAPGSVWESELLADRLPQFSRGLLDEWTLSGRVLWFRIPTEKTLMCKGTPRLHGRTPIVMVTRSNLDLFLSRFQQLDLRAPILTGVNHEVFTILESRGALFLDELSTAAGLTKSRLLPHLSELIHRGVITMDGFEAFRALVGFRPRRDSARPVVSESAIVDKLLGAGRVSLNPWWQRKDMVDEHKAIDYWADLLLHRYGVVTREHLRRERFAPSWREISAVYSLRELRGELRSGRFVTTIDGQQFCTPAVLEQWEAFFEAKERNWQVISAADPCNLFGYVTNEKKIPALRHTKLLVWEGQIRAIYQNGAIRHTGEPAHSQKELFARALRVSGPIRRVDPFLAQEELRTKKTSHLSRARNLRQIFHRATRAEVVSRPSSS